MGRIAKPVALKLLSTDKSNRSKINKNAPQYEALKTADPPEWIDENAKECWAFFCPRLIEQKILTEIDLHNLTAFCCAFSRFKKGEEHINKLGIMIETPQGIVRNPAGVIINEALKQMASFGARLGIDPASRQKLIGTPSKSGNPFLAL